MGIEVTAIYPVDNSSMTEDSKTDAPLHINQKKAIEVTQNLLAELSGSPPAAGFLKAIARTVTGMVFEG